MKRVILSGFCLVAGFLLFCLLHLAQLNSRYPIYDYAWMFGSILVVLGLLLGFIGLRKESKMPIIASTFSFAPILILLLWRIPFIGIALFYLFFGSAWGLGFCLVGLVLGIISLFKGIKHRRIGIILSSISIFAPFGWVFYLFLYVQNGGEIFL